MWPVSGGWVIGACPHSVVYTAKSILRCEGAYDFVDSLRSLKHRPNVVISDIAHTVASCASKIDRHFFHPFEGRLGTADDLESEESESEERKKFSLPFLQQYNQHNHTLGCECHPITGSSDHYSLFDWFHEGNVKSSIEYLRRSSLVTELAGSIDTQTAEQFFSSLKRDIYFVNEMQPVRHLFLCRLIFHLHNEKVNKKLFQFQARATDKPIYFNSFGQVYHGSAVDTVSDDEGERQQDVTCDPLIDNRIRTSDAANRLYI